MYKVYKCDVLIKQVCFSNSVKPQHVCGPNGQLLETLHRSRHLTCDVGTGMDSVLNTCAFIWLPLDGAVILHKMCSFAYSGDQSQQIIPHTFKQD